ncbi:glycosyltransferase family 2 protein [Marinobacter lutaoensis]|uniref:glycosyltransferase family 2 protein n=1 Tax=Marinobacter lutaoensis TaxID=135739 RepID=UPI00158D11BC|nr:glycosyltransferase family A protein [Marinobacter lutaoensis]
MQSKGRPYSGEDLTVVIPAHNCAEFVAEAIASVEAQTIRPALIIVVENASSDGTRAVLESLVERCSVDLQVLHTDYPGVSNARNLGFSHAHTRLVAMLDADDMYCPDFLQKGLDAFNTVTSLQLFFGNRKPYSEGQVTGPSFLEQSRLVEVGFREAGHRIREVTGDLFSPLLRGNFIPPSATIVVREAAYRAGLFPLSLDSSEDRLFYSRLVRLGTVAYSLDSAALYRIHDLSKTRSSQLLHLRKNAVLCLKHLGLELSGKQLSGHEQRAIRTALREAAEKFFYTAAEEGPIGYAHACAWAKMVELRNPKPLWFQLKALRNSRRNSANVP